MAQATEAGHDFVGHVKDVVRLAILGDRAEVVGGRGHHPTGAHDRFGEERGNLGWSALALDEGNELVDEPSRELLLGLSDTVPVVVR